MVQFMLGNFDYGLAVDDDQQQLVISHHLSVADATRQRLEIQGLAKKAAKGTSLRELHNDIFDAIVRGKGRNGTIFVGSGSRLYGIVGKWVPSGIVGWMMGFRNEDGEMPIPVKTEHEGSSEGSADAWDRVGEKDSDEEAYVYAKD